MPTKISICSNALELIGEAPISALTEGSGPIVNRLYDTAFENLLAMHPWRFAIGKADLARLVATPLNEWSYAFQIPADCLNVIRVYPDIIYEIYEDKIYADVTELAVDYKFTPSEANLPAYFVNVFQMELAGLLALPVTDNASAAEVWLRAARESLPRAKAADSQQRPPTQFKSSPFLAARN